MVDIIAQVQEEITVAAPPTTTDAAAEMLASMAALTGTITDYNPGSIIRTFAEAQGAVIEQQGVGVQALAFQTVVYGAMATLYIFAGLAVPASGTVSFTTRAGGSPPPVSQNVGIPIGTLVATAGGVQFATTSGALLASGSSSINVPVTAIEGGIVGNVPPESITILVNNLAYPLQVINASGTSGGNNAETASQTLARFAAARAAIPSSTPSAIANAAIGVSAPGTGETVKYSTLFEPWVAAGSGAGSGTVGWQLFLDNGDGTASSDLITAVDKVLSGTNVSGAFGYRDAGVPYSIFGVTPTVANVSVYATVVNSANLSIVSGAMQNAVSGYFTLPFGVEAEQAQIAAVVANVSLGLLTSLNVELAYATSPSTPVSGVIPPVTGRVTLGTLSIFLSGST